MVRPADRVKAAPTLHRGPALVDPGEVAALREKLAKQAADLLDLRWQLANLHSYYGGFRFRLVDRINDLLWKSPRVHRLIKSALFSLRFLQAKPGEPAEGNAAQAGYSPFCEGLSVEQSASVLAQARSQPLISIVVPIYKVAPAWLERCLASVEAQHYQRWELLAIDDGSQSPQITQLLEERAAADPRIRVYTQPTNGGICRATNRGLEMARGDFVGFLDHDDELTPDALAWIVAMHNRFPQAAWFYSDEDKISETGRMSDPFFKPDWSPEYLLGLMYTCHFSVYATPLLRSLGGVRVGFEGAQDHDLALRAAEQVRPEQVVHIPRVLYHWRTLTTSTAGNDCSKPYASIAGCRAVQEALDRRGLNGAVTPHPVIRTAYQIQFRPQRTPHVTIIVPTRNAAKDLKACLAAARQHTKYPNYRVLVIDNQSDEPELARYLAEESAADRLQVMPYDRPFNHSRMHNEAIAALVSEYVLLMNNDVVIQSDGWLEQLVATVEIDSRVAGVGALLTYPDGTIQHAGIVLGICGTAGHSHRHWPAEHPGYGCRPQLLNEASAATAALLLLRRSAFLEVGGFNAERYPTSYNDVDLWLRLRQAGYRCLYNPQVQAMHYESKSRGRNGDSERAVEQRFRADWAHLLACDPFYSPNLSLANEEYRGLRPNPPEEDLGEYIATIQVRAA